MLQPSQPPARSGGRLARLYWLGCSLLASLGVAGVVLVLIFPPEHFDEEGRLIGEMPPEFAVAWTLIEVAAWAALVGLVAIVLGRALGWLRRRGQVGK